MEQETELQTNVENWQWKWKLGIVAIFSLPITLLHPGHAGVGLQHPRINLDLRYDQDQDQRLGPGVLQEAGLGWAGLEAAVPVAQPAPAQTSSLPGLHYTSPPCQIIIPTHYTLHTVDTL